MKYFLLLCLNIVPLFTRSQDIATADSLLEKSTSRGALFEALEISKKNNHNKGSARAFHKIGYSYYEVGNYDLAFENYLHALTESKRAGDFERYGEVLYQCGEVLNKMKLYNSAIRYIDSSYTYIKDTKVIISANATKARALFNGGKYEEREMNGELFHFVNSEPKVVYDAVTTAGTNIVSSNSVNFSTSILYSTVMIWGAGPDGSPLVSTIEKIINFSTIEIFHPASTTLRFTELIFGAYSESEPLQASIYQLESQGGG